MDIREIDDRYPEFATTKGKTGKKHKYKKLSMKDKMVTKILAMSVAGAVVLDAGATAISNEINGDDSPGFFMGIFEQEPAKIAPRLENEATSYAKKKVTVEFDLVPNDMDTVLDIHLDLMDNSYPVTLDENWHGKAVIDVDLPDGEYSGLIVCDYLMKKEAEIAIPFAFEVTIPKPLELMTYEVSYDHDTLYAVIGVAEKDAENIVAHITLDGVEYEKALISGKADIEVPVVLKSGDYNVPLKITYILDDEEKELEDERSFSLSFKGPEITSFKIGQGTNMFEYGKAVATYKENDGKVTGATLRITVDYWVEEMTGMSADGAPIYETVTKTAYENVKATVSGGKITAIFDPLSIVNQYGSAEMRENEMKLIVYTELRGEKGSITKTGEYEYGLILP